MTPNHTMTNTKMERIILAVLLTLIASCSARPNEQIVGGSNALNCEFPHMVYIDIKLRDRDSFCGATLLSDKWVLTAAHCLDGDVIGVDAHIGSTNKKNASQVIKARQWIPHPEYSLTHTVVHDVAVLELSQKVRLGRCVSPLKLPNKGDTYYGTCTAAGWGQTGNHGIFPDKLQRTRINIIPTSECQKQAAGITAEQHICVGDNKDKGKNVCGGDSGGGLVCRRKSDNAYVVAGIASYVFDCDKGFGVYANVANFLDYIKAYMSL
ncbi:mast cell protease 1A [Octopus bimaculoides]|uniref:Peptidase S1 domain-containing protein n=1 Tax=Octopus bimaculoides TaxID=37653 RepID=A0A0L8G649_OCTBM|nr:mast cell protease 1A [Octopus bimaculoides]|eukprot:XP_014784049.1 PREDICTED: mast cell protease 1A-like [Octopus bimaculoides]